jgi:hypothetical protein
MKITRTEEGTYTRTSVLDINEDFVEAINSNFKNALVGEVNFTPLTLKEFWDIIKDSDNAPRAKEEYPVNLRFFNGNMKLGSYIRCEINEFFEEISSESEERPEVWYDEFES